MKSTIKAMTQVESDLPVSELISLLNSMDGFRIESLESTVENIIDLIVSASESLKCSKSEILAKVIRECLLSEDENPNHIYGPDLIGKCNKCLIESLK